MYVAAALSMISAAFAFAHGGHAAAARGAVLALAMVIIGASGGKPRPPWSVVAWVALGATLGLVVYEFSSR
jgi:phosphate/sulfate permease